MDETRRQATLTEAQEQRLAEAVEAGVLAAGVLHGDLPRPPGASDEELGSLVRAGERARERLLGSIAPLVGWIARQEQRGTGSLDDLVQEGWVAAARALQRYDHRKGRFLAYAAIVVRGSVRRAVAELQGLSERQLRGLRRVSRVDGELSQRLGRSLSTRELDDAGDAQVGQTRVPVPVPSYELDLEPGNAPVPGWETSPVPGDVDLAWLVAALPEPTRSVIRSRYGPQEGVSLLEVGRHLGLSKSRVARLERQALAELRGCLVAAAATAA